MSVVLILAIITSTLREVSFFNINYQMNLIIYYDALQYEC